MTNVPEERALLQLKILDKACALDFIRAGRVGLSFDGIVLDYSLRERRAREVLAKLPMNSSIDSIMRFARLSLPQLYRNPPLLDRPHIALGGHP